MGAEHGARQGARERDAVEEGCGEVPATEKGELAQTAGARPSTYTPAPQCWSRGKVLAGWFHAGDRELKKKVKPLPTLRSVGPKTKTGTSCATKSGCCQMPLSLGRTLT